jgi:hypothetical protein
MAEARQAGKVVVRNKDTGEELERWPIDAREMVATGNWETDAQFIKARTVGTGEGAYNPPSPVPHLDEAEALLKASPHALMNEADSGAADPAIPEEEEEVPDAPKKKSTKKK